MPANQMDNRIANMVRLACAAGTDQEAANAALKACRMMVESGAVPKDSSKPAGNGAFRHASVGYATIDDFKTQALERRVRDLQDEVARLKRERPSRSSNPVCTSCEVGQRQLRDFRDLVARLRKELKDLKNPPVCIKSKYNGTCKACGDDIAEGDMVWWAKGIPGVNCIQCG